MARQKGCFQLKKRSSLMKRCVEILHRIQNQIHFGIVYSQEFVFSSNSVGIIMLSFRAFLDDELIHRFIFRFT